MDKETIKVAALLTGGVLLGGAAGVLLARDHYASKYETAANLAIEQVKEVYAREHKEGDFATPEQAAAVLIPAEDRTALEIHIKEYDKMARVYDSPAITLNGEPISNQGDVDPDDDGDTGPTNEQQIRSIWDENNMPPRRPGHPYVVTIDEYMGAETEEKITLTYYDEDGVLADSREQLVDLSVVGDAVAHFGVASGDPLIVYVFNERLSKYFEVVKDENTSYAKLVMKLDQTRERPVRRGMRDTDE